MTTRYRTSLVIVVLAALVAASGSVAPAASLALSPRAVMPTTLSARTLTGVSLSPSQVTVQVANTFTLDVLANCGTHADAAAVQVAFDPVYMEVVSVTKDESAFPDVLRSTFDNTAGTVYYDAGSLLCHSQGSCPAGAIRMATITFRAKARAVPTQNVSIYGQVTWQGNLTYDGPGSGSTITITSPVSPVYLPLVMRAWGF